MTKGRERRDGIDRTEQFLFGCACKPAKDGGAGPKRFGVLLHWRCVEQISGRRCYYWFHSDVLEVQVRLTRRTINPRLPPAHLSVS